jgi:hypothetical protein
MRRHTCAVLTATMLVGALAACSSAAAQPTARLGAGSAQPVAAGTQGASAAAGGSVALPSDLTISYQFPMPTDPVTAALVDEAELIIGHYESAVTAGSAAKLGLDSLLTGPAGAQLYGLVASDTAHGSRPSGTIVFFDLSPEVVQRIGSVGVCENDSQSIPVGITTDRPTGAAPTGPAAHRLWQLGFNKNSAGKYLLAYIDIQAESRACI